jgi:hypothetical protein
VSVIQFMFVFLTVFRERGRDGVGDGKIGRGVNKLGYSYDIWQNLSDLNFEIRSIFVGIS